MHNSGTIISKTGVRYQVNGQMVVDEAVDHLWEPENLKTKIQMVIPPWNNGPAKWGIFCPFFIGLLHVSLRIKNNRCPI